MENKEYVFGRALVVGASNSLSYRNYTNQNQEETDTRDGLYLCLSLYDTYTDRNPPDDICSGLIILEVLLEDSMCSERTSFVGVLYLLCSKAERNELLRDGCVRDMDPRVKVVWFTLGKCISVDKGYSKCFASPWRTVEDLENIEKEIWIHLHAVCYSAYVGCKDGITDIPEAVGVRTHLCVWSLLNVLDAWKSQQLGAACPVSANITQGELSWAFFVHITRTSKSMRCVINEGTTFVNHLEEMNLYLDAKDMEVWRSYDEHRSKFGDSKSIKYNRDHLRYWAMLSMWTEYSDRIRNYIRHGVIKRRNGLQETNTMCRTITKCRQRLHFIGLYASQKIEELQTRIIKSAPLDPLDERSVKKWALDNTKEALGVLDPTTIVNDVTSDIGIKSYTRPLRLYGASYDWFQDANKFNFKIQSFNVMEGWDFAFREQGQINANVSHKRLSLIKRLPLTALREDMSFSQKVYAVAASHTVPLWCEWKDSVSSSPRYCVLEPCKKDTPRSKTFSEALDEWVIATKGGYEHEIYNTEMDVRSICLDIDLTPSDTRTQIDTEQLFLDVVDNVEQSLGRVNELKGKLIHYVFASENSSKQVSKYGIHHFVVLPDPYVISNDALHELITLLAIGRYRYGQNSLGAYCGDKSEQVYDPAIYTKTKGPGGHLIRGAFQKKPKGEKELKCVYRTDKHEVLDDPIDHRDLLIHAQGRNKQWVGNVIKSFTGIKWIDDKSFHKTLVHKTINDYVETSTAKSLGDLVCSLNKRSIIFDSSQNTYPTEMDKNVVLNFINKLWVTDGWCQVAQFIAPMISGQRRTEEVNRALRESEFVEVKSRVQLRRPCGKVLPFCPIKNHEDNTTTNVTLSLYLGARSTRFGLQCHCFKDTPNTNDITDTCRMQLASPFLLLSVKDALNKFLTRLNKSGTRLGIVSYKRSHDSENEHDIPMETDNKDDENQNDYVSTRWVIPRMCNEKEPLHEFMTSTTDIKYLYMFLESYGIAVYRVGSSNTFIIAVTKLFTGSHPTLYKASSAACLYKLFVHDRELKNKLPSDLYESLGLIISQRDGQQI